MWRFQGRGEGVKESSGIAVHGSDQFVSSRLLICQMNTESESEHLESFRAVDIAVTFLLYFTEVLVYNGVEIKTSGLSQQIF